MPFPPVTISRERQLRHARCIVADEEGRLALNVLLRDSPPLTTPDPAATPEQWSTAREEQHRVRRALAALPPEQGELIELACYGGYSQSELADRTGLPLGTIKTRMRLGMMKLRTSLSNDPDTVWIGHIADPTWVPKDRNGVNVPGVPAGHPRSAR